MSVQLTPKQLLDLLGVQYREMSNRLLLCCPFHGDRNPSSNFYHSTGLFYCFACELTLDVVGFYAKFKQLTRLKAEFELIATYGGEPEVRSADPINGIRLRKRGEELLRGKKHLPRKQYAALGEQLDKILFCFMRKLITDEQMGKAIAKWYLRVEQAGETGQDIE